MKFRDHSKDSRLGVLHTDQPRNRVAEEQYAVNCAALGFFNKQPYKLQTVFGYVTLLDPELEIKNAVFKKEKKEMGLNEGETLAFEYLRKGCYYSTTGMPYIIMQHFTLIYTIYFLHSKTNLEDN
jgi:hypothetical protein